MSDTNDFLFEAIKAFLIPVPLGALYYCLATVGVRYLRATSLQRYWGRVGLVFLALPVWWLGFAPWYSQAVLPPGTLNFNHPPEELGSAYGLHTIWVWCGAALAAWPKRTLHDSRTA
jgi:hypothetical protein